MAYDTKELEKQALKALKEDDSIVFIDQLCLHLPCSQSTFYDKNLDKSEAIKEALIKNKLSMKAELRGKWRVGENATLQLALYKLIGNEEEFIRLSNGRQELTGKDGEPLSLNINGLSAAELKRLRDLTKKALPDESNG